MALHYVDDYASIVQRVFACLPIEGRFIFSVEHPVCTANPVGWTTDADGHPVSWPLDNYRKEGGAVIRSGFVDGVVKFHRTTETYVTTLLRAGFRLDHFGEPTPLPEFLSERPALSMNLRRPPILSFGCNEESDARLNGSPADEALPPRMAAMGRLWKLCLGRIAPQKRPLRLRSNRTKHLPAALALPNSTRTTSGDFFNGIRQLRSLQALIIRILWTFRSAMKSSA